jgi:hypothetical protein
MEKSPNPRNIGRDYQIHRAADLIRQSRQNLADNIIDNEHSKRTTEFLSWLSPEDIKQAEILAEQPELIDDSTSDSLVDELLNEVRDAKESQEE